MPRNTLRRDLNLLGRECGMHFARLTNSLGRRSGSAGCGYRPVWVCGP